MQIDTLSTPQQQVIRMLGEGKAVPRRFNSSIKALKDSGYLDDSGALNDVGRALLEDEPQRFQTTLAFRVGDRVEHSYWGNNVGAVTHAWRPATVKALGKQALRLELEGGTIIRCYARNARKVK